MNIARSYAANYGGHVLGTEHILLGLSSVGLDVLAHSQITTKMIEDEADRLVKRGSHVAVGVNIPYGPIAERSVSHALNLQSQDIGAESVTEQHMFVALLQESEGIAAKILTNLGFDAIAFLNAQRP